MPRKAITPKSNPGYGAGSSFGDVEFFRANVAERAASMPAVEFLSDAREAIVELLNKNTACFETDFKTEADFHSFRTESLVQIAALCERAVVDIAIPKFRAALVKARATTIKKGKAQ